MTVLTASTYSASRYWRQVLPGLATCLLLWGCGQPVTGPGTPAQNSPATWIATVTGEEDFPFVYVLSVQQGRVLSADVVGMSPEILEDFNESDGHNVLRPEYATRLPVEGLQQSGQTILGRINFPRGDDTAAIMKFTITLSKELQGSESVPARIESELNPKVHDLVFKRHPGLKIGHKANYERVPGPVAKPLAEPVLTPPGPVFKMDYPLFEAARGGDKATVAALLAKGTPVNARDAQLGQTALHDAAIFGHLEIAELLLAHGAAVDATDKGGRTPLYGAVSGIDLQVGHRDIVELLLAKGANINHHDKYGNTPLFFAPTKELARLLLDRGADFNVIDLNGGTMLASAASRGWPDIAEWLLAKGAKVNAKDVDERTPLHQVATREVADVLLAHGADVNAKDEQGSAPLHLAVGQGRLEVAESLLAHGAAVNAKDDKGHTPLKYVLLALKDLNPPQSATDKRAKELIDRYEAIAKLLREHGAKE